jgi:hypothetical protein
VRANAGWPQPPTWKIRHSPGIPNFRLAGADKDRILALRSDLIDLTSDPNWDP